MVSNSDSATGVSRSCDVAIIGGGLLCWASLDIPPVTYVARIREVVPITDLFVGRAAHSPEDIRQFEAVAVHRIRHRRFLRHDSCGKKFLEILVDASSN